MLGPGNTPTARLMRRAVHLSRLSLLSFLLGAVVSQPVWACPMTLEAFTYPDGAELAGQDGGQAELGAEFTSSWETDLTTPDSAFTIENGQVVIGNTGGQDFRVERGIDLSEIENLGCPPAIPDCVGASPVESPGSTFIYSEFTQVVDNHDAYEISTEFSDAFGVTAAFGIQHDGIAPDDYFFATLGDQRLVTTLAVAPDTPYFVYGVLDIDINEAGDDRFRMWVNPDYADFLNGINEDASITLDLESLSGGAERIGLGDIVALTANTQQEGTTKTFDDLQIFRDAELLAIPRLDIGNGAIQLAFAEWTVGATPQADFSISYNQALYVPSLGSKIATLTLEAISASESVVPTVYALAAGGVADDLRSDSVEAAGGLRLTLGNLHQDQYFLKTFHYQTTDNTPVDIYLSKDGGVTFQYEVTVTPNSGTDDARQAMFSWQKLSESDVVVEFRPTVAGAVVALNGLQFVPEPGTALLLGLGLAGLSLRSRRTKRSKACRI